jgi:tryptophanyl-tRNA synthetase
MSKSDRLPDACIFLSDEPEIIKRKIMRALTDAGEDITFDESSRPGLASLMSLFALVRNKTPDAIAQEYVQIRGLCQFKMDLVTCLIEYLAPFRSAYLTNVQDPEYIESVLVDGSRTARQIAQNNLEHVKSIIYS